MPRTVIFSKIASVILDMEKLEDCLSGDFLSILNRSEITIVVNQSADYGCKQIFKTISKYFIWPVKKF